MEWVGVVIQTIHEKVDLVANVLYDAGVNGVVVEDPEDILFAIKNDDQSVYIDPGLKSECCDKAVVKGYFPANMDFHDSLKMIQEGLEQLVQNCGYCGSLKLSLEQVREEDWANSWKKYYKPLRIGNNIIIKPSWENYDTLEGDILISIDPGMAFGTGTHETTALCIQLLERYVVHGGSMFDIGCGSGILSIVGAKLGAVRVDAFDIQRDAVRITKQNAELNGVSDIVHPVQGNMFDKATGKADIIVSNIIADIIIKMTGTVKDYINPGGIFISSGIIKDRMEEVISVMKDNNIDILKKSVLNEWCALVGRVKG